MQAAGDARPALERKESIGSSMFNWSLGRKDDPISPDTSREASVHGNGEGKSMPWAIKLKFGTDSERPV